LLEAAREPTEHFAFKSNVRADTMGVKVSFVAVLIACAILLRVIRRSDGGDESGEDQ